MHSRNRMLGSEQQQRSDIHIHEVCLLAHKTLVGMHQSRQLHRLCKDQPASSFWSVAFTL
jgi:hypothetical protein